MPPDVTRFHDGPETPGLPDRNRIEHMLKCSRDAQRIVAGDDAPTIAADMVRSRALVNCFTEIGEAAARLSLEGRARVGALPW